MKLRFATGYVISAMSRYGRKWYMNYDREKMAKVRLEMGKVKMISELELKALQVEYEKQSIALDGQEFKDVLMSEYEKAKAKLKEWRNPLITLARPVSQISWYAEVIRRIRFAWSVLKNGIE